MKNEFVWNERMTSLINIAYIRKIILTEPCLEQKNWTVVAELTHGTQVLCMGTVDDCVDYMDEFYKYH